MVTEVSGADPWYTEASKMLGEAALRLAHDELPATAGQVTPAAAMGQPLIDRLVRVGIRFRVLRSRCARARGGLSATRDRGAGPRYSVSSSRTQVSNDRGGRPSACCTPSRTGSSVRRE